MLGAVRVVAITDPARELDIARAVAGCEPGSVMIQIRGKALEGSELLALARTAAPHAPIAINDRVDIALAFPEAALHLPEDGLAIADARTLAPDRAVGVSRHAIASAVEAVDAGADLVQLGPIFATPSKPGVPPLGVIALRAVADAIAERPTLHRCVLVAVGGIDSPDRAREAAQAGADAVAVIRAAWTGSSLRAYVDAVEAGRAARSVE